MKIVSIAKNSIAEELNIPLNSILISFNGIKVIDVLDYEYYNSQDSFKMTIEIDGRQTEFDIEKDDSEDLGLEFNDELSTYQCKNNCIFCFVKQLPRKNLRHTLYVRDDDYRHSFISGNYITMTNISDEEIDRIIRLKLSPLYISVHSTNNEMRKKLLGVKNIPDINEQMKKLVNGGIQFHAQIVYCPSINEDLHQSIMDLSSYALSLAIVPVGLTKAHNDQVSPLTLSDAQRVIELVNSCQKKLLTDKGTRFVFAADELYLKAQAEIPPYDEYEDFPQIENGVGLIAQFTYEFNYYLNNYQGKIGNVTTATGESAYPLIKKCAKILQDKFGGKINVKMIKNEFFGSSVTVAGLIVGEDILNTLLNEDLGDGLIIPRCMLREFGDVFLDDMTISELSKKLNTPIIISENDGEGFIRAFGLIEKD